MPGVSSALASTARQQYQATAERWGRKGSPSASSSFGAGSSWWPNASAKPARTP